MTNETFIKFDPNLVDVNEGHGYFILLTVFTILIVLSTGTRIATKLFCRVRHGVEDYLIVLALAVNLAANVLEYQNVNAGFGRHLQFLSNDQAMTVKKLSELTILLADISLCAVKISICFFLLAMIENTHRRAVWVIYGLATITTIASTCQAIFWGLQAQPLQKLWNPEVPGTVANPQMLVVTIITFTAINSVTDLFYALSPLYFFRSLQIDLKKKMLIFGLTGSGLLVFTASIIRVAYVRDFFEADYSWGLRTLYMCTIVERNLSEVIADLPAINPLLRSLRTQAGSIITWLGSSTTRTGGKGGSRYSTGPSAISTSIAGSGLKADKFGDFAAYGIATQLDNNITADRSEDAIPLWEGLSRSADTKGSNNNGGIMVHTSLDVLSHSIKGPAQERDSQAMV